MRDNYGDKITIETGSNVELTVTDHDEEAVAVLSPAKARKLAKKLRAAADEVDPRPETSSVSKGEPTYLLALTQEQAETLAVILAKIGGPYGGVSYTGRDSARRHATDVAAQLADLGLDVDALEGRPEYALDDEALGDEKHAIYFAAYAK